MLQASTEKEDARGLVVGGREARPEPWKREGIILAARRVMAFWAKCAETHSRS